jgi:hypothetical protein
MALLLDGGTMILVCPATLVYLYVNVKRPNLALG